MPLLGPEKGACLLSCLDLSSMAQEGHWSGSVLYGTGGSLVWICPLWHRRVTGLVLTYCFESQTKERHSRSLYGTQSNETGRYPWGSWLGFFGFGRAINLARGRSLAALNVEDM